MSALLNDKPNKTALLDAAFLQLGDKFYRANGDVLQADHNAVLNVRAKLDDSEIYRFTPHKEVRRILLLRSPAQLSVNRLELGGNRVNQMRINPMRNYLQAFKWQLRQP